ncbi:MAG: FAD-binding oxidoreductase [Nanoarchaeota archaeon]|nr:FAD-binding oxidoreductase [Nanoarchaeota archaeon]
MVLSELKRIVGEENISKEANIKLVYSCDASTEKGEPEAVVWPETIQQVQDIIRLANKSFVDVVVRGAGTGLAGGAVPKKSIILNTSKMNKVLEYSNGSVMVEPGVILDDLNNKLFRKGFFFPVIPASHAVCTIGGMIACNAAGKRAVHYGKTSNWVNYLEVVDGNARIRRINDVKKFCGSEGILGVIVKAELKLAKLPAKTSLEVYKFDNVNELMTMIKSLINKRTHLLSLELLDKFTSSLLGLEKRYHLIAEFDNHNGSKRTEEELLEWNNLRDKAYTVLAGKGFVRIQDPEFKSADALKEFMQYLELENIPFFGHSGLGVIHPCLDDKTNIESFYKKVLSLGGNVTGEHGIGLTKKKYLSEEEKKKIDFHKKNFDRNNIMNRGKVL